MGLFSFLGVLSPIHIQSVKIFNRTKFIGADSFGNKYYTAKPRKGDKRGRRFVIYKGAMEASKIPPEWHGWIHHQTDIIPNSKTDSFRRQWQKPHHQNLTGTKEAYFPLGHDGVREKVTGDYEAWNPPQ